MEDSSHYHMSRYLIEEGAQQIKNSQSLYFKCNMLVYGPSECELLSILPSDPKDPFIMTFPIPRHGHEKRPNGSLLIDIRMVPHVTICHLDTILECKSSVLTEEGDTLAITPSMLETGRIYGITPGTTLAKKLGWEQ